MRIRLVGDHSSYHCGSDAAIRVIRREVLQHGEIVSDESDYDLLVVNGEGSMHHDSKACRRKIAELDSAVKSGRGAMLINTVWQDNSRQLGDVLRRCDSVVAREIRSARELREIGIKVKVRLDQAYFCDVDNVEPVDFDGRIVVTDFFSREFETFARVTGKWAEPYCYLDMRRWTWSELVASLRTASLLITGRHHAVYAACKARLPFLAVEGNTHKIGGLVQTARSEVPVFDRFADMKANMDWPEKNQASYDALFDWMEHQPHWTLWS